MAQSWPWVSQIAVKKKKKKSSSAKSLPTVTNVSTNKLIPNENGVPRTEAAITSVSRYHKIKNKKVIMLHTGNMLDPIIYFTSPFKDSLDTWEKVFCLQTIHTGVTKRVSSNSSIEFQLHNDIQKFNKKK